MRSSTKLYDGRVLGALLSLLLFFFLSPLTAQQYNPRGYEDVSRRVIPGYMNPNPPPMQIIEVDTSGTQTAAMPSAVSLAIVFDSTGSMGDDLKQVKMGARRILQRHMERGREALIKDFVLVKVHDPDVGPARVTTSTKTFYQYLESVYTQGGGDCPEMTITGIEMALEASHPNSLIYVFTDSSAKDYERLPRVLNLIQKKQSQVVFVLTGYCNSTSEPGFQAYQEIATVSSGQVYLIGKRQVTEFMRVIEAAVEARKVQILQQDTWESSAKTYSFPVDSHLTQLTVQVTNYKTQDPIKVNIRNPEGKLMTKDDRLRQLMKTVPTVFVASIDQPMPGSWTLEVSTEPSEYPSTPPTVAGREDDSLQWHSVRVSGVSEVDFVPGFATTQLPHNVGSSRQPIEGVQNFVMANITGRLLTGTVDSIVLRAPNGTSLVRLPVERTPNTHVYVSQHPMDPIGGHYYLQVTGRDGQGYNFQRYSKVALIARKARPVVVSCPAKIEVARGATAAITCLVDSEIPFKVNWYQSGQQLTGFPGEHQTYSVPTNVTYTLADVNEESQGIYAVEMVRADSVTDDLPPEGQRRDEVSVVILPPPPTVFIPRNASVEPGGMVRLTCSVFTQASEVEINWYRGHDVRFKVKDGRRHQIRTAPGESTPAGRTFTSTLTIAEAQDIDVGKYICEAEHKGGVSSADGFVIIHVRPTVVAENTDVEFKEGGRIVLSCRAEGHPPPKITWRFNDVPIPETGREALQPGVEGPRITIIDDYMESRLIISPTEATDAGRYSCHAANSAGEEIAIMNAKFVARPEIVRVESQREMPQEGESQVLRCLATGQPPPSIKWEFNGSPVSQSANIRVNETTGELMIMQVKRTMTGKWTCVAENVAGTTRSSISLDVGYKPKMDVGSMHDRVLGEFAADLLIPCYVEGQPVPQIKWYKMVGSTQVPVSYGDRYTLDPDNSLHIRNVDMEDGTTFICEASNTYGRDQHHVTVELGGIKAPTISFTDPRQVILEGSAEKMLTCYVLDAKPPATVTWLKDSQEIDLSSPRYSVVDNNLIIRDIKRDDEGVYTCVARNVVGRSKVDIELDVQTRPAFTDSTQEGVVEITRGKVLELRCMVEGDPKPKVEWRKDGRPLNIKAGGMQGGGSSVDSSVVISNDGQTLTVYAVTEETSGVFTCSAINPHAVESKDFQVVVKTPPLIEKEGFGDIEIAQHEATVLTCLVSQGFPQPEVRWFKNGQPVVPVPGRITIMGGGNSLEIRGESEEDTGSYECRAENEAGSDSRFYQVTVLVPPMCTSTHAQRRLLVRTGDRVDISCGMTGYPEPTISWTWNGRPLEGKLTDLGIATRLSSDRMTSYLTINNMQEDLQGNYTCVGQNRGGQTSSDYEVILLREPKIVDFSERAVVFLNNTITLTCGAEGNPKPKITWLFMGQRLSPDETPGYRLVGDGNLMIMSAQHHHGGEYTCLAENDAGRDDRTATITVFEPSGDRPMAQNITSITLGGNITFTCKLTSNPPPRIKWYKDGQDLFSAMPQDRFSLSADESTLTIFNVQPEDQGQFKCEAENIPGDWDISYFLEVTSSPNILLGSSSRAKEQVRQGSDIRLRCIATGSPEPTYQWLKDDTPVASSVKPITTSHEVDKHTVEITTISSKYVLLDQGRELVVSKVTDQDAGVYTCVAINPVGRDRHTMNLTVLASPVFHDGLDHETPELVKHKPAFLWCNATGHPPPKYKWSGDIISDQSNERIRSVASGRGLYLPNVTQDLVSRYICNAINEAGEARRVFDPTLIYAPVLVEPEGENPRPVIRGGDTRLSCEWDAHPEATVEWFKGGEPIDFMEHPRVNISIRNTVLFLGNVQPEDAGIYRCVVTNKVGSTRRQWSVAIMSPPKFQISSEPGQHNVALGSGLTLFCVAEGEPKPTIWWTKDGMPLDSQRYNISENGVHLRLSSAEDNDAGRFACIASSPYGEIMRNFDVKVTYPPRLDGDGQRQYSLERTVGSSAILECLVTGNPTPKIEWYKDGQLLDPLPYRYRFFNQKRELEILSIQPTDAGRYRCFASNEIGSLEVSIDMTVGAPPRIDRGRLRSEYVIREGDELVLPCPATGSPTPRLEFTRSELSPDSNKVTQRKLDLPSTPVDSHFATGDSDSITRRAVVSQDRQSLTIFRVTKGDAGTYQCNASNEIGWDTMKYTVRVRVPPSFDTSNVQPEVHWFVNQSRFLDCTLQGLADPPATITWERHGSPVTSTPDVQISPDGTKLTVPRVQLMDAGDYKCVAANEVGRTSQTFRVLVYVRAQFVNAVRKINIDAIQNQTVHMSCEVTGDPPPKVTWFKRDVELFPMGSFLQPGASAGAFSSRFPHIMPLQGEQILQLTNVQREDAGDYTCMATNGGDAIEKKFNLSVILPPVILKPQGTPEAHMTREHVPVTFYCLIRDYNSTKPDIVWTKDGSPILVSEESDYFVVQDEGQSLTVIRPTSSESGMFRCEVRNKAGTDSHQFRLTVIAPPRFPTDFIRYRQKLVQQMGTQVRLECPATGSPPPVITWYYNGSPVLPYTAPSHYTFDADNKLLYFITGQKDAGEYRCVAHSEAGNISKTYELEVIMPPLVRLDRSEIREREGTTFTVQCIAEGHPTPKLEWSRESGGLFRVGTSVDLVTGILTISEARKEDAGRYTCTATNKISQDSKTVDVQIIERPVIQSATAPIVANEGDQILLPCTVTGTLPIQIQWRLPSGQQITQDEIIGFQVLPSQGLLIEQVSRTHAGLYRCSANNEAGSQNAMLSLDVQLRPTITRPANTEVSGQQGAMLQLNCEVSEGIPKPVVTWEHHGVSFSKTKSFYTTTDSGLLIFNSLKQQDEGEWICIARNAAGEDRLSFNVLVRSPPRVSMPSSTVGVEGRMATIECTVEGKPMPEVTWEFKNQLVGAVLGTRARIDPPTRLTIHDLKPTDTGSYFCVARAPGQELVMDSTFLTVFTIPKFVHTPNKTMEAYEDRWIQFRCAAEGHPKPDVKWMHQGSPVPSNPSNNGIGSLVIGPLRESHSGTYTCVAFNEAGKAEYSFRFTVKTRPKVHIYQSDEPWRQDDRTRLHCNVSGEADSIVWLKDGIPVANSSRVKIRDNGASLVISMAKAIDTGLYQCIAANPVGEDLGELRLIIDSKPVLVKSPQNQTARLGEIVTMECQAEGHPIPTIRWFHDNSSVRLGGSHSLIRNGSLRIVGVTEKEEGTYHCVASSSQGEAISNPAELKIQIPGGWSDWLPWQACSVACGRGIQARERICDNPEPQNGGSYCVGDAMETRSCLQKFCPVDGVWGQWSPWTACSSPCGSGLRHRTRRCDSPPPSNGGKPCVGNAMEDELCEDLPLCPVNGGWSSWGPWSTCTKPCGPGGTQRRERKCDMPPPSNGGKPCIGSESMVRACERKNCPVDGGWGEWGPWTHCSRICGGGIRRRQRRCDNPKPQFGGKPCGPPEAATETAECHENPCPINGGWSNWASWSPCVGRCGLGIQSRLRTCTEPAPQYGGHLCRGSAKEQRACKMPFVDDGAPCPSELGGNGDRGAAAATWSEWSAWTECQPDCTHSPNLYSNGKRRRVRECIIPNGEAGPRLAKSLRDCEGHAEEVEGCFVPEEKFDCDTKQRPLFGQLEGEISGRLNGLELTGVRLTGNWSAASPTSTRHEIQFHGVPAEHSLCLQALLETVVPALWYTAREVDGATNGEYVVGRNGAFSWNSVGQFADGSTVRLEQRLRRVDDPGEVGVRKVILRLDSTINGDCPLGLRQSENGKYLVNSKKKVEVANFKEQIVQLNPSKGTLHASSSRYFSVSDEDGRGGHPEPNAWSAEVMTTPGRRQRHLTQTLVVDRVNVAAQPARRTFNLTVDAGIVQENSGSVCPLGFEIVETRGNGGRHSLGDASLDYCRDVDECSSPRLNSCDQICENTSPGYRCSCREGYRLAPDGRSCVDIDECSEETGGVDGGPICPSGQLCVNKPGSFECVQDCGEGLRLSASGETCEDIDECRSSPDVCSGHQCINTYGGYYCSCSPGYELIGNQCQDINECNGGAKRCQEHELCVNLPGSFRCQPVCPKGYRLAGELAGSVPNCVDINECQVPEGAKSACPEGATCINVPGSFRCQCADGRPPVGNTCQVQAQQACPTGFRWSVQAGRCVDIDECNQPNERSPCQYQCHNTVGGYRCSCPLGYELNPLTNLCADINECKTSAHNCSRGQLCVNTPGSHVCLEPSCPKNYQFDAESKSCRIACAESNLPCPQGARFADSVQYLSVSIPPPSSATGRNIILRVVDWQQTQQANCHFQLLDKAPDTPVQHRSESGVVYLTPDWRSPDLQTKPGEQQYINAVVDQARTQALTNKLFYLFFRVSCFSGRSAPTGRQEFDVYPVGEQKLETNSKLIFQHSFYVYISVSKYPF